MQKDKDRAKRGQRIGLLIAGLGLGWIAATTYGVMAGLSHRAMAFFDLAALAGFAFAIWMIYGLWKDGRQDKD